MSPCVSLRSCVVSSDPTTGCLTGVRSIGVQKFVLGCAVLCLGAMSTCKHIKMSQI
jgi:hypothetical protein